MHKINVLGQKIAMQCRRVAQRTYFLHACALMLAILMSDDSLAVILGIYKIYYN